MSCDNGNILPIPLHNCLAKRYQVLFLRNMGREIEASGLLPPFTTIEQFMLKNQHGIIVAHRAFEDAFSMIGIGDADYFQAWHMHEKTLWTLPMLRASICRTHRSPHNHRNAELPSGHVAHFGRL